MATPSFSGPTTNPYGLSNSGTNTNPNIADLDGDGDLDVLIGNAAGDMDYFQNTGTPTAPAFAAAVSNPFGFQNIAAGGTAPATGDLDNDGDLDVLSGDETAGAYHYFENTGSSTAPAFAAPITNSFGLSTTGLESSPAFIDLDNDGDLDILAGGNTGDFHYFENTGTPAAPAFAAPITNPFGLTKVPTDSNPTLADIDFDGDYDLLTGTFANGFWVYENTGSSTAPAFAAPLTSPYGINGVFLEMAPSFGDLDGDGKVDIVAITASTNFGLIYYNNTSPVSPSTTVTPSNSETLSVSASQSNSPVGISPSPIPVSIRPTTTTGSTSGTTGRRGTTGTRATTGQRRTTRRGTTGEDSGSDTSRLKAWPEMITSLKLGVLTKIGANAYSSLQSRLQSLKASFWASEVTEEPKVNDEQAQAINKLLSRCGELDKPLIEPWLSYGLEDLRDELQEAKYHGVTEDQLLEWEEELDALEADYVQPTQTATASTPQQQKGRYMSFFKPAQQTMVENIPAVLPQPAIPGRIAG
jgi:uncharacterized protein YuzB (UPF0349 family)